MDPIYDQINAMYLDIKSNLAKRGQDPLKYLSKTVPVLEVGDYLRDKLVDVLFKYRVPAAFFMSAAAAVQHLQGQRKTDQARENLRMHIEELTRYLDHYFRDRDELVALADEKLNEKELTERKKKYDQLMAQAEALKKSSDYDAAIGILRQAIEVFPGDIGAYLESGRLYVRRREYGRALARFSQAEELFQDAPVPNKEIASLRLTQVKEKIAAGANPESPEIKKLLDEAVENFTAAHDKAVKMEKQQPADLAFEPPLSVGQEILKWNTAEILGSKHPAVKALMAIAEKSTEGLDKLPVDQLSTRQCLTLGLQALEAGDAAKAQRYYFRAIRDDSRFAEVCTEINYMGIRLRTMGRVEDAIKVYNRLLKYKPHNQGSIYWNLALAYSREDGLLNAAGYAARCLYTDPAMAREKEFYDSLTPKLAALVVRLMKILRFLIQQQKAAGAQPQLKKLYAAKDRLDTLIAENRKGDALKLFLTILKQAPGFAVKPEFHGDGVIGAFLTDVNAPLTRNPQHQATVNTIGNYLKYLAEHPVPPKLEHHLKLAHAALQSIAVEGDQPKAAFHLGQALMVVPEAYFKRPDFYARDTLPAMVRELAGKFAYVDVKKFPRAGIAASSDRPVQKAS